MATFTWAPDAGSSEERKPRIRSVQFGDGYEQRSSDGLNNNLVTRGLSFTGRSSAVAAAIEAFLSTHGGITSFDYTHPGDISRKYVCKSWKVVDNGYLVRSISCEFKQVPM